MTTERHQSIYLEDYYTIGYKIAQAKKKELWNCYLWKIKIWLMRAAEIKTELQQLIEHETDMSVLQAIYTILIKTGLNPKLKEKLTLRALKSEEDINEVNNDI